MKYNYNKNQYLHIVETFDTSAKPAPVKQIKMRIPPRTLEPISETDELDIQFYCPINRFTGKC